MIEPKEYNLRKDVKVEDLLRSGFLRRDGSYVLKSVLYKYDDSGNPAIYLVVGVSLNEPFMVYSIVCDDGCTYPPFYNVDQRYNNLVYDKVVENYNNIMDRLVKRKILKTRRK